MTNATSSRLDASGLCMRVLITTLSVCASVACDFLPAAKDLLPAAKPSDESRYQLMTDRNGRVVRLDTTTGEITVAEPAQAARKAPAATNSASKPPATVSSGGGRTSREPTVSDPTPVPTDSLERIAINEALAEETRIPITRPNDVCSLTEVMRRVVTLADTPVYKAPNVVQAPPTVPLINLASGIMVMVEERSGDWLLIRFEDPRWGPRAGYAHCSQMRALSVQAPN